MASISNILEFFQNDASLCETFSIEYLMREALGPNGSLPP